MSGEHRQKTLEASPLPTITHPISWIRTKLSGQALKATIDAESLVSFPPETMALLEDVHKNAEKLTAAAEKLHDTVTENNRFLSTGVPNPDTQTTLFDIEGEQ